MRDRQEEQASTSKQLGLPTYSSVIVGDAGASGGAIADWVHGCMMHDCIYDYWLLVNTCSSMRREQCQNLLTAESVPQLELSKNTPRLCVLRVSP